MFDKITNLFVKFTPRSIRKYKHIDKVYHFIVGLLIGLLALLNPTLAFITVCILAIGKELYDKFKKNTKFDVFDAFVTITGTLVTIFLINIV